MKIALIFLAACSGAPIGDLGGQCVAKSETRACDGTVLIYTGTDTQGTMSTCEVCTRGASCTFESGGTFVDGVCK